ncbi:NADPH-dependent 2,4-dienoyl-CoA reductase, sulfur reductase [Gracilibacillus orientalis]|uniref:NADPH-dependent 2,4-dienoyl-CoA reductase, sulfur reductase n=1 Tax=Gracilibacillus orientalis TaxID=334253 RepID=A0A1I4KNR8_9BACI|nr:CoA-disulfide reductase [Gracilibacillus orientalis]SFL80395.1 NADPH-dependent 2,4-dienoyl-CoA reductase, sulfur reductase [Gracilibacillus orientalis]
MKYIVIGGVAAGMSAAMEINRTDELAEITVLERGENYSYGQCGLPYVINGMVPSTDAVIAKTVETFREKYDIDARVHTKVTKVDIRNQQVSGINLDSNQSFTLKYDRLLIATGSDPILPKWSGIDLEGIHTLKTLEDTDGIMADITEEVKHVTIVGAGYIGLEMAESFRSIGKKVTLIQRGDQLAKVFDQDMSKLIENEAVYNQVDVKLEEEVTGFSGEKRVNAVITDKGTCPTDLVLVSAGVRPNTKFLKDTAIQMNREGAIHVNAYMETSIPNVYAAGDCATHYHIIKQLDDYIPLGTTSNKQGRIAGANMARNPITFKGIVGTSIIKFFDLDLGRTGITETEAKRLNISYKVETRKDTDHAGYYPGVETLHTKLIYHSKTGQLLGGQIIGKKGVDKRIDVLATALYNQMTIQQLQDLDLAYAPPYNSVWDPIQKISRKT